MSLQEEKTWLEKEGKSWLKGKPKELEWLLHELGTTYFATEFDDGRPTEPVIDKRLKEKSKINLHKSLVNLANYELQRYAVLNGVPLRSVNNNFDIVATIEKGKIVPVSDRELKKFGKVRELKKEIESLKTLWTMYNRMCKTMAPEADVAFSGELLKQTIKVLYTIEGKSFDNDKVNDFIYKDNVAIKYVVKRALELMEEKDKALDRELYQDEMVVDEKTQVATKKNFADIRAIPETKDEYIQELLGKGDEIKESAEHEKESIRAKYDEDANKLTRRLYRGEIYDDEKANAELKKNYAEIRAIVERYKRQIKECMAKGIEIRERAEQRKESSRVMYAEDMNRLTRELYKAEMAVDEKTDEVTKKNFADIRAISETHGKYVHDLMEKGVEIRESAEQEKESIRAKYIEDKIIVCTDKQAMEEFNSEL